MQYKLLAIDMDGTMLKNKHEITDHVKYALIQAKKKGIMVALCTGRIYTSARYYARLLETEAPIIGSNGAFIKEYYSRKIIYKCAIPKNSLEQILKILSKYKNVYYQMYGSHIYYTKEINDISLKYYKWNKLQREEDRIDIRVLENPIDLLNTNDDIYKILISEKDIPQSLYLNLKEKIKMVKETNMVVSMAQSIDIINKNVNKGNALKIVAKHYGIKREEIMAIGDNYNDIEMLEYAGLGVAMGNAEEATKKSADFITDTNLNDGVAKAIDKFILKN